MQYVPGGGGLFLACEDLGEDLTNHSLVCLRFLIFFLLETACAFFLFLFLMEISSCTPTLFARISPQCLSELQ